MSELLRSRHAFGSESNLQSALDQGLIDSYDILFLKEGKIGWIDAKGNPVILEDKTGVETVDALPESGETSKLYIFNSKFYFWNGTEFITPTDETGLSETEVNAKIKTAISDSVNTANAYTDKMVEAAMGEHLTKKYEVTDVPTGTLVNISESEIRIMCPENSQWVKQSVGEGGDASSYYMTFKTYAPSDDVVGYIEHLGNQVDAEVLTKFSVDEYGRRYQPTWLALAKYDEATDDWTYYGAKSTVNHYIGWDYQIDWYNADGIVVASDCIRINLANEKCYHSSEPYYVNAAKAYTDEQIANAIGVIEF